MTSRRTAIATAVGAIGILVLRPASATPESMRGAISAFAAGALIENSRVVLDIAPLVDNGNTVPVSVRVDSPMTAADHVTAIAVFSEHNPNTEIAVFHLGPRAGRATVGTRMRLATSQRVVALARTNTGRCFQHSVDVLVTLAACIES